MTYEDCNLVYADDEPCIDKRDVQLFFKRLRKSLGKYIRIKYYCVGEYGDQWRPITPKGRPHYHALIFLRGNIDWFRVSVLIKQCWSNGIAQVLPVLGAQGYVTKYILKFDKREHSVKPFSLISRGLGIDFLSESMVKYYHDHLSPFAVKPGGYKISLPRYYKDKIFSPYEKLVIKRQSDVFRRDLEFVKLQNFEIKMKFGINPFFESVKSYQNKLYQAMKLYREKKKL